MDLQFQNGQSRTLFNLPPATDPAEKSGPTPGENPVQYAPNDPATKLANPSTSFVMLSEHGEILYESPGLVRGFNAPDSEDQPKAAGPQEQNKASPIRIDISEHYHRRKRGRPKKGEEGRTNTYHAELQRKLEEQKEEEILAKEEATKHRPKTHDEWISYHVQNALSKIERPKQRSNWKHGFTTQNYYMQVDFEGTRKHIEEDDNPGNFLSAVSHLLRIAPVLFREVYIYNCKTSTPTFYRHMKPSYLTVDGRRVKVVENLSPLQKDLARQVFEQLMVYMDNEFRKLVAKAQ